MLIEKKVQINAIKTDDYRAGKIGNTVVITQGSFAVYVPEEECRLDISKLKEIPINMLEEYSSENLWSLLRPVELTNKVVVLRKSTARLLVNKKTNKKIWVNKKYLKMFKGCGFHLVDMGKKWDILACTRGGRIIGIIFPMDIHGEWE